MIVSVHGDWWRAGDQVMADSVQVGNIRDAGKCSAAEVCDNSIPFNTICCIWILAY